ncbi:phage tail tube protein [Gemmobacter lutimaris]|jgi:hypothetical protein|uniref:phage tail tube protein n=1 Tax=Gemmobacter lutimaris TaxID=2306023 RepID=UPI0018F59455|nr:hypothetical protein [Gemmobacter lutimaris]
MPITNNYTLGRGEIYFARRDPVTKALGGERYLGNTPEFNLTFESENLEHFSSDRGIREKDRSVILQITRSGSLVTDNVEPQNVALFFFGSTDALTVAQATTTETFDGVEPGMFYQLGMTALNPSGAREVIYPGVAGPPDTTFVVEKVALPSNIALAAGTDYVLNTALGRIEILEGGALAAGDSIEVTFTVAASTRTRIISGSSPIEGALRFVAFNPTGDNIDYFLPSVSLSPNGDYALKSDEWQQIPFTVEVLKPDSGEALYADGRAVTA